MRLRRLMHIAMLVPLAPMAPAFSAVVSTDVNSGVNAHLQTQCDPTRWSGDVVLRPIGSDGRVGPVEWSFSERLAAQEATGRNIYTINDQTGAALSFQRSRYAELSATQRADMSALYSSSVTGDQAQQAGDLIDYLRGDTSLEPQRYRDRRGSPLGDIIRSSPAVVAAPGVNPLGRGVDGAAQYPDFAASQANRDTLIYVGANDGMLHAIDQQSGNERFAFIPHGVFAAPGTGAGLHQLAKKGYVHRRYVDASPMSREAYVNLNGGGKAWHTLLAGGLGAGGRSVYLLDVTDPGNVDTPAKVVRWEFTHPDLGHTFSEVQIARLGDGKWYAIFGNGYNAEGGDGRAKLFLVNLEAPGDYLTIDTGVGHADGGACDDGGSDCNGLSSPELADINGDGIVDWAYAGDLHGNVWAFDFPAANGGLSSTATRLFSSCSVPQAHGGSCSVGDRQPITTRVALARNARLNGDIDTPNINVYWGTGRLLTDTDATDITMQAFYSVLHTGNESGSAAPAYTHGDLAERSYIHLDGGNGSADARGIEGGARVNYRGVGGARQYGWTVALSDVGERLLSRPVIVGDVVAFNSMLPGGGGPCDGAASGWVNALSLADGLAPDRRSDTDPGRIGDDQVFDYNADGAFDAGDRLDGSAVLSIRVSGEPASPDFIGDTQYIGIADSSGSGGAVLSWKMQLGEIGRTGRVGWYQLR